MPRRLIAVSTVHFWWPEKFENVANRDFENLKHLQNFGHFLLTAGRIWGNSKFPPRGTTCGIIY